MREREEELGEDRGVATTMFFSRVARREVLADDGLVSTSSCGSTCRGRASGCKRKPKRGRSLLLSTRARSQKKEQGELPWTIGLYHTKRKTHSTGPLGEIQEETYDDVNEPIGKCLFASSVVRSPQLQVQRT